MTIRHLTVFAAVAEQGSMSAAAKHLYLSQPTVSQAIRELEAHYNGLLFERLGKKLYLTERGKLLLPHAREMIRQFQQLEELMQIQDNGWGQAGSHSEGGTKLQGGRLSLVLHPLFQMLKLEANLTGMGQTKISPSCEIKPISKTFKE